MCLLVSWVVIGPVILCWCLALQFRIKRDTQDLTRMVVHRSHFCISSSCPSFVSMVTASTSLMTVASSCLCSDLSQYLEATTGLLSRINDHLGFRGQQGCPSSQRVANGCNSRPGSSELDFSQTTCNFHPFWSNVGLHCCRANRKRSR